MAAVRPHLVARGRTSEGAVSPSKAPPHASPAGPAAQHDMVAALPIPSMYAVHDDGTPSPCSREGDAPHDSEVSREFDDEEEEEDDRARGPIYEIDKPSRRTMMHRESSGDGLGRGGLQSEEEEEDLRLQPGEIAQAPFAKKVRFVGPQHVHFYEPIKLRDPMARTGASTAASKAAWRPRHHMPHGGHAKDSGCSIM